MLPQGGCHTVPQGSFDGESVITESAQGSALTSLIELSQVYLTVPFSYSSLDYIKHETFSVQYLPIQSLLVGGSTCIREQETIFLRRTVSWEWASAVIPWVGQCVDGLWACLLSGLQARPFLCLFRRRQLYE